MLIDVRPGRPDHVYLSDFGLSKGALSSGGVTRTGHVVGTPAYLAPEQGSGGKVDGRTDQYSLACVAYELLTGVPPFLRDDAAAMIYAHLCEPPPLATARQPSLPSAVDSVLARAMSKSPEQRFLTCQEFAESLRAALGLRPYAADPGMSVGDGHHGAAERARVAPSVAADDRYAPSVPEPSGSPVEVTPPPASAKPGRAPGGEGAPGGSGRVPPGALARMRRRAVLLFLTALALAALTVAGVVVAMRAPPSPELVGVYKPVPGQLARVSVGLNGQVLGAGYTCGECGTQVETDRPLLVEQNGSAWSRLAIPGSSRLTGASVSADGTIYVVGYRCLAHCGTTHEIDRPLILRWHGGVWSRFTPSTPKSALLTGVSAAATGTIFAVGYTCEEGCATLLPNPSDHPLILRSDGSRWSKVISPSLPDAGSLSAVSTLPDGDAWVAGAACTPGCRALILHWNGSVWSRVLIPSPGQFADFLDISTTATGGWASGWYACKPCRPHERSSQMLIFRWDGHSWWQVKSPDSASNILWGIAAADRTAWAVGEPACETPCKSQPALRTVILRWNGSDWSRATPTPVGDWPLTGIVAEPGGGAVAVGHVCISGCGTVHEVGRTVILRLNGSRWSVVR